MAPWRPGASRGLDEGPTLTAIHVAHKAAEVGAGVTNPQDGADAGRRKSLRMLV